MAKFFNHFRGKRAQLESDLDRELRYHIDRRVDDMLKQGLSESEARRQAQIEFGGVTQVQEEVREEWTWRWLDTFAADVRYALRGLARNPAFSAGVISVLALGISASVAIFSVVNSVLLRPLHYPDADRIVVVENLITNTAGVSSEVSGPDFLDWKAQSSAFENMAVSYGNEDAVTLVNGRAVFANVRHVSAEFFDVFGQAAAAGRLFTEADTPAGESEPTIAVVSNQWAVAEFGTPNAAVGKIINVYGSPMEIVGVASPGFRYPGKGDIWAPWSITNGGTNRSLHNYRAVAKLNSDATLGRARLELRTISEKLAAQHPENRFKTAIVTPLQERLTGDVRKTLMVLMAAVIMVLLIACANISNLLLARAAVRTREIALRAALGAGRRRLVRQLLTESAVLGAVAGGLGLGMAFLLLRGLIAMAPTDLPRLDEVHIDGTVLLFALALSLLSTMVFGLLPALHASRLDLSRLLKQGGSRGATVGGGARPRAVLVVAEVALSVVLLASAGLLVSSFQKLQNVELGFTTDRVLVASTEYAVKDDAEIRARSAFYQQLLERVRLMPGVTSAAGVAYLPMGREPRSGRDYFIRGRPDAQPGERPQVEFHIITPEYFTTLDIPLRGGRDFDITDGFDRPPVAIVNEALARASFPGQSAIGQFIRTNNTAPWMEIIGVVGNTRWQDPTQPPAAILYASSLQGWGKSLSILVRTSLDEASLSGSLRSMVNESNPNVPVRFETMQQLFGDAVARPRFRTQLIGAFAMIAALLAAVGIFSVLAYLVGLRTREIAVRRAIGAEWRDVVSLIIGQSMRLVGIGLGIGLIGAFASARLLQGFLYEMSPWNAAPYAAAVGVIAFAALLATLIPALRAANITPVVALQQE